jgi:hypothetical protein
MKKIALVRICLGAAAALVVVCGSDVQAQVRPLPRIINGTPAAEGSWPWMAALISAGSNPADPAWGQFCGASLIAPRYVVTAAHCAEYFTDAPEGLEVVVGVTRLSDSATGTRVGVEGIILHPKYDPLLLLNDIALIKLAAPVPGTVLPMVGPGDEDLWKGGTLATIIGWGSVDPEFGVYPDVLQEAQIPIQSDSVCVENLGRFFNPTSMLCAGKLASSATAEDAVDSCYGDSGSPLMVPSAGGWKLAGITSWGFECGSARRYGAYTRVAALSAWAQSAPPIPPRVLSAPFIEGNFEAGTPLSCNSGTWAGDNLTFSYQWWDEEYNTVGTEQTLVPSKGLEGKWVACVVTASNASGESNSISDFGGPVLFLEPTPVPTPVVVEDFSAPSVTLLSGKCRHLRCQVKVAASDDDMVVRADAATFFHGLSCQTKGRRTCTVVSRSRIKRLVQEDSSVWSVSYKAPGRGTVEMLIRAYDRAGNTQTKPLALRLRARR